ncbi:glycosyl hydrolase family 25 [Haloactinospora alba]|uniref:Lysozyme n=1 Tax=Haloactinospora alba TaxID=405555 RepID=A0A543NNM2_9ACTN|nr:GH25 family lysozyme [Haloactinospora alba]TQN33439.1 glycosyl hydrolase family 25 [Haloactinospora alba]
MPLSSPRPTPAQRTGLRTRATRLLAASALTLPAVFAGTAGTAAADPGAPDIESQWAGATIPENEGGEISPDPPRAAAPSGPQGIDVSHHQGTIDWSAVSGSGIDFAYMKATESTGFEDSEFDRNYVNSYQNGIIRGAYHFARPNHSGGVRHRAISFSGVAGVAAGQGSLRRSRGRVKHS